MEYRHQVWLYVLKCSLTNRDNTLRPLVSLGFASGPNFPLGISLHCTSKTNFSGLPDCLNTARWPLDGPRGHHSSLWPRATMFGQFFLNKTSLTHLKSSQNGLDYPVNLREWTRFDHGSSRVWCDSTRLERRVKSVFWKKVIRSVILA